MGDLKSAFAPCHDLAWFATKGRFTFPASRPKSVLRCKRLGGNQLLHPTQKPVELMRELCEAVTPAGGTICDPFMGSGSTGVAAVAAGFRFIGIELDGQHFKTATTRLGQ